jgi:hypothetical protein
MQRPQWISTSVRQTAFTSLVQSPRIQEPAAQSGLGVHYSHLSWFKVSAFPGDIIYYEWNGVASSDQVHLAIVTGANGAGNALVTCRPDTATVVQDSPSPGIQGQRPSCAEGADGAAAQKGSSVCHP